MYRSPCLVYIWREHFSLPISLFHFVWNVWKSAWNCLPVQGCSISIHFLFVYSLHMVTFTTMLPHKQARQHQLPWCCCWRYWRRRISKDPILNCWKKCQNWLFCFVLFSDKNSFGCVRRVELLLFLSDSYIWFRDKSLFDFSCKYRIECTS